MTANTNRIIRTTVLFGALLLGSPATQAGAGEAASTVSSSASASPSASSVEVTKAAPAKVRRAARARRVCTGRGRARRCSIVGAPAPAPAPAAAPAPAPAPAPQPQALPAGAGDANAFGFLFPNGGNPGRWNPCAPVHYSINSNRAPAGGVEDVQEAIHRVSQATGINFAYDGPTGEVPQSGSNGATVIAWATPQETDLLTNGAAGVGGASGVSSGGVIRLTRGFVVLDATRSVAAGFGGGQTEGALLMHELGHMVGLDHSGDQAQVMYPTVTSRTPGDWGAADRNGLARVGSANGCVA